MTVASIIFLLLFQRFTCLRVGEALHLPWAVQTFLLPLLLPSVTGYVLGTLRCYGAEERTNAFSVCDNTSRMR